MRVTAIIWRGMASLQAQVDPRNGLQLRTGLIDPSVSKNLTMTGLRNGRTKDYHGRRAANNHRSVWQLLLLAEVPISWIHGRTLDTRLGAGKPWIFMAVCQVFTRSSEGLRVSAHQMELVRRLDQRLEHPRHVRRMPST